MEKQAMYNLSYGLFVLTASSGKDNGCIINTAMQVTSAPNRITIAVNKQNYTHDMIISAREFNLSVLSEKADFEIFKRFGFQSGSTVDKFADFLEYKRAANGITYITQGVNAVLSAKVIDTVELGTHTLFIAAVTDGEILDAAPSATYAYYQSNIKPQPAPAAPVKTGKTVWRCTVCGYEYEGEELPDDFICPLCKHPASDFEKIVL